jgi:hypothetical protein
MSAAGTGENEANRRMVTRTTCRIRYISNHYKGFAWQRIGLTFAFSASRFFSAERYGKALPGKDVYMSPVIMSRKKQLLFFADREIKLDLTVFVLLSISTRYDFA